MKGRGLRLLSRVVNTTRDFLESGARRDMAVSERGVEACAFAYCDGLDYVFIARDLERRAIPVAGREGLRHYLVEGREYELEPDERGALSVHLPAHLGLVVERLGSRASGGASPGATRPALTETGLTIRVPPTVVQGETVVVDTATGEFVEPLQHGEMR